MRGTRRQVIGLRCPDGSTYPLPNEFGRRWVMGTSPVCDLRVERDLTVSNAHCVLERRSDGGIMIRDATSTNGTYVDGTRVEVAELHAGASLKVGATTFTAIASEDEASASAPALPDVGRSLAIIKEPSALHHYLRTGLHADLEALEDLGSNESDFQHNVIKLIESRLDLRNFKCKQRNFLERVGQFPDIQIVHAHGDVAFELKRNGTLEPLLNDASKLKGYLREVKRTNVKLGVLIYVSPKGEPARLRRAMTSDRLVLVRVSPRRT